MGSSFGLGDTGEGCLERGRLAGEARLQGRIRGGRGRRGFTCRLANGIQHPAPFVLLGWPPPKLVIVQVSSPGKARLEDCEPEGERAVALASSRTSRLWEVTWWQENPGREGCLTAG